MAQYECMLAGLPELHYDDNKSKLTLGAFIEEFNYYGSASDKKLIESFYLAYDNQNLLQFFRDREAAFNPLGVYSHHDIETLWESLKQEEQFDQSKYRPYIIDFVKAVVEPSEERSALSTEDQLASAYYNENIKNRNTFISHWFRFNLNIVNIFVALNCRKYGLEPAQYIVGNNAIAKKLRTSTARDFGVSGLFEPYAEVAKIWEEPDFMQREKKLDMLRWNYITEASLPYLFSIEKVFTYLIQLSILNRWAILDIESGNHKFKTMVHQLSTDAGLTNEFLTRK